MIRKSMTVWGAVMIAAVLGAQARAATGIQVGPSGKTYASGGIQCALHPVAGMSPVVRAGLYNPKKSAQATVSLNGAPVGLVTFISPDTNVWLVNGLNVVAVSPGRRTTDSYTFDAASSQVNVCIPDTSGNAVVGALEYSASTASSATVVPGCAFNPLTGRGQPYVMLFTDGKSLLNVSVNNVPLTQLYGTMRPRTPVFLSAGLNVVSAGVGNTAVVDYYVRDGGTGVCALP